MARKKKSGHRTASGQLSRAVGAQGKHDEVALAQPHRKPFATLLGDADAGSYLAAFALGRLRLIGRAEERGDIGPDKVRAFLFPGRHAGAARDDAPEGPFGLSEREFFAAMHYLEAVGRERWVRASPKDKPSALDFLAARGIDLAARELTESDARRWLADFEEVRAVLAATPCPPAVRSVLGTLRRMARKGGQSGMVSLLRGLGAMVSPATSGAIVTAVNRIVLDDRDPDATTLRLARPGFAALAEHFYGIDRGDHRKIRGVVHDRPTWTAEGYTAIEPLYENSDGTLRKAGEADPSLQASGSASRDGRWKNRHRSLAGG